MVFSVMNQSLDEIVTGSLALDFRGFASPCFETCLRCYAIGNLCRKRF